MPNSCPSKTAGRPLSYLRKHGYAGQVYVVNPRYTDIDGVACYPSIREGYGLPVLEAMSQGTPVVTSADTATEEAAAGAAVLVDPYDVADIARGIAEAVARRAELSSRGRNRAARATWHNTAELTAAAYRELV